MIPVCIGVTSERESKTGEIMKDQDSNFLLIHCGVKVTSNRDKGRLRETISKAGLEGGEEVGMFQVVGNLDMV